MSNSSFSYSSLSRFMRQTLREAGIEGCEHEARIILMHAAGKTLADLIALSDEPVSDSDYDCAMSLVKERIKSRRPLSKILGEKEFYGLVFKVNEDTLDPRPDTEILIDKVLERYKAKGPETILDLGTGAGCIAITLLKHFPKASALACDVSEKALEITKANAKAHGVADRLRVIQSHWFENVDGAFDCIVSNPPYIKRDVIAQLEDEVKNHDPILALDGGADGLQAYQEIFSSLHFYLNGDGRGFFEIGFDQKNDVVRLVESSRVELYDVHLDYRSFPRVVEIYRGDNIFF